VALRPVVLLTPSRAAAVELPRRLASATDRALTGLYPVGLADLARVLAEPVLWAAGLKSWDRGHDALLAARLLNDAEAGRGALRLPPDLPTAPVAAALARTLSALRGAGTSPSRLDALAARAATSEDRDRLRALSRLYAAYLEHVEGVFADPAAVHRAAAAQAGRAPWLSGADVLIVDDLELEPAEAGFLEALARAHPVRRVDHEQPAGLVSASFADWADRHGIQTVAEGETLLAPAIAAARPAGLRRLTTRLFDPPDGGPAWDGSVELVTAPGEAAEVRALVRRLLREAARRVPFEEMGILLPRPHEYAPLVTDLLERLGVPYRLHPSLPLRFGRSARSLLLLFRCRGLLRSSVMEFLTFAPVPFAEILGPDLPARPAQWDALSRDAGIVSGYDRWIIGLRSYAEADREEAAREKDAGRRDRRLRRAAEAEALLRVVELLSSTHDGLAGEASWPEWSARLRGVVDQWLQPERDREAVLEVIGDLAGLGFAGDTARWDEVEAVLEARFEWERLPLTPLSTGGIHVGALDAVAGLPFRVVAIPGLVEGGYPGVLRPDPFLLDPEREALSTAVDHPTPSSKARQLSLFEDQDGDAVPVAPAPLPTTQDRVLETRRAFLRAVRQARERLILSYPRADSRTGRERMPSLFLVAAGSALEGRPISAPELEARVVEDDLDRLDLADALDASERDRLRVRRGGNDAAQAVAAGSTFFKQSRLASSGRWWNRLTAYDGFVAPLPAEVARQLDPVTAAWPISASRLGVFARCGFQYLLESVLRLEPALEPEERRRLEPLERGLLFHSVAEDFLRERRDRGELPVRDTPEARRRILEIADAALAGLVAGSPPRFVVLWERERARFRQAVVDWLGREAASAGKATPIHFEVGFGPTPERHPGEPHRDEPLAIDLGDGRVLKVAGKIDRIDQRDEDGALVLRDYKTGRAPRGDASVFRGGKQLQIPFYVLAAEAMFPGRPVAQAFLDYVDGGRQVNFDPATVKGERFRTTLKEIVDVIAQGSFVQEPSACDWCDFTVVCGPKPLLEIRRRYKMNDPRLQRVLRLRDL
jgi:RecB family exonuclease